MIRKYIFIRYRLAKTPSFFIPILLVIHLKLKWIKFIHFVFNIIGNSNFIAKIIEFNRMLITH